MSLATLKELMTDATERKYAVPCLMAGNLEMLVGTIKAAEELDSPLILCFNQSVTPTIPMETGIPMIVEAARRARVPIAATLDHGHSLEAAVRAIHLGSSSVMFDGSLLPYEENVRQTKDVVRVAHAVGVSVEAELGKVGGSSIKMGSDEDQAEDLSTDPELAADFVERTGVDVLAIRMAPIRGNRKSIWPWCKKFANWSTYRSSCTADRGLPRKNMVRLSIVASVTSTFTPLRRDASATRSNK